MTEKCKNKALSDRACGKAIGSKYIAAQRKLVKFTDIINNQPKNKLAGIVKQKQQFFLMYERIFTSKCRLTYSICIVLHSVIAHFTFSILFL